MVGAMNAGGAETVFMKYYRKLDRSRYQIDFCVSDDNPGFYDDEIRSLGGNIVRTVKKTRNPFDSFKRLEEIARHGRYCCAVRSSQHSLSAIDLAAIRRGCNTTRTVFRSSNTGTTDGDVLNEMAHRIFKPFAIYLPDACIAPSVEAGIYMFGERRVYSSKFQILHNALDLSEYAYSDSARNAIRSELGISSNAVVIGHVGRFNQQKNHRFALEVFAELAKGCPDAVLLLFGKGELFEAIRSRTIELGLAEKVVFGGVRHDVSRCYSAMDALLFPSLYEGMPNVVVEAQANGLPCLISDSITSEVAINSNLRRMPLSEAPDLWARRLCGVLGERLPDPALAMREAGYDIDSEMGTFVEIVFGDDAL